MRSHSNKLPMSYISVTNAQWDNRKPVFISLLCNKSLVPSHFSGGECVIYFIYFFLSNSPTKMQSAQGATSLFRHEVTCNCFPG